MSTSSNSAPISADQFHQSNLAMTEGMKDPKFKQFLEKNKGHRMFYDKSYMYGEYLKFLDTAKDILGVSVPIAGRTDPAVVSKQKAAKPKAGVAFASRDDVVDIAIIDERLRSDAKTAHQIELVTKELNAAKKDRSDHEDLLQFVEDDEMTVYWARRDELTARIHELSCTLRALSQEDKKNAEALHTADETKCHVAEDMPSERTNAAVERQQRILQQAKHQLAKHMQTVRKDEQSEDEQSEDDQVEVEQVEGKEDTSLHRATFAVERRLAQQKPRHKKSQQPPQSGGAPVSSAPAGRSIKDGILQHRGKRRADAVEHSGKVYGFYGWQWM